MTWHFKTCLWGFRVNFKIKWFGYKSQCQIVFESKYYKKIKSSIETGTNSNTVNLSLIKKYSNYL